MDSHESLVQAVMARNNADVKKLVKTIDQSGDGYNALVQAAGTGNIAAVRTLIKEVSIPEETRVYCRQIAVNMGCKEVAQLFI